MDDLQATYKDDLDDDTSFTTTSDPTPSLPDPPPQSPTPTPTTTLPIPITTTTTTTVTTTTSTTSATPDTEYDPIPSEDLSDSPNFTKLLSSDAEMDEEDAEEIPASSRKRKSIEEVTTASTPITPMTAVNSTLTPPVEKRGGGRKSAKKKTKAKAKGNNVWTKPASRKGKKRTKSTTAATAQTEDAVLITPVHRHVDKNDDAKEMTICLSKVYKAEKVELSEDRMSAGSCKGYRMVRATRGVMDGAWYFEIKVVNLGETGHTRLGWCMEKGDLQAPVGYDGNSYGYRDVDGSKVHKALREKYGEGGYVEGDVIGFYINLPDGNLYAPKSPKMVMYKGQRYTYSTDSKEVPPKVVPGSEICFFKNGVCQGSAFKDLHGGCYYPAASMYTLPHQSNCVVKFNFGPDFEAFPEHFGERPIPKPMVEVPYHNIDSAVENGIPLSFTRTRPMLKPQSS